MTPHQAKQALPTHDQAGFTLLEILLVIVMIAVTSAMVVPSISNVSQGSVSEEAKRLRLIMRLAMEESQLSGLPLRWLATEKNWSFEVYDASGEWLTFDEPPLTAYQLPQGVRISQVEQAGDFFLDMGDKSDAQADVIVGMVLLLPDGTTSQSNIQLEGEANGQTKGAEIGRLQIRPGPAGIRLQPSP
ncbi:MAG: type II secretion system protein [Ghiorsea sp.]